MGTSCGYVALLGRPNSGKSTLLNACLGQKIVGVSCKPQTTRNRVLGIDMAGESQLVFLDSPGIHKAEGKPRINQTMNKVAWSVAAEADVICYLVDVLRGFSEEDETYLKSLLAHAKSPVLVLASKTDAAKKQVVQDAVAEIESRMEIIRQELTEQEDTQVKSVWYLTDSPLQISAKRKDSLTVFRELVATYLPEGPWLYDPENLTDKPEKFVVSELIRESLFRRLAEELPYGCGVRVEKLIRQDSKITIRATIIVARSGHKPMVIGKQGKGIKAIGIAARESIERHYSQKVRLELFVRVEKDWVNDPEMISAWQQIEDPY